jgi:hypothetical protein
MLLDWLLGPAFAWPSTSSPTPTRRNKRHFDVNNHPDDQTEKSATKARPTKAHAAWLRHGSLGKKTLPLNM